MIDKTICELFAGVGGFRLGFERSSKDWKTVWANQWEPGKKSQHAFDCYCHHFGNSENHVNQDISIFPKDDIPDHNLLVGGFPCQDYSVARTGASGIEGKKGVLWWQIRDVLAAKEPRFVLLENVDRLLKSPSTQRGRDFGVMLACLNQLDYSVEWRIINASEYGFAQRRRRVFIFAYKNNTNYANHINSFSPINIINNQGFFAKTFPIAKLDKADSIEFRYDSLVDVSDQFQFSFHNSGYMYEGNITTGNSVPIIEDFIPLETLLERNVDKRYYINDSLHKWEYLKGSKKIKRISKDGHEYVFSEGPIAFPDPIDKPARTMLTSESSLNRSTHIIEDPETKKLRKITPIEAERIQGFEDDWTKTGMPERFRYFCMGNALVVGLITRMGTTLNKIFETEC
ncbi:DNA (cytosine-5-)-methyltransferase [Emergencia sp.]|uniref:DNA (cytosine-5-)-methyltransferase n=1 Tax=Emergencia sp. TaxID=1926557 RepID=UPI003AF100B7